MHTCLPFVTGYGRRIKAPSWLFLFVFGFSFAIPIAPEDRIVLFDVIALGICIVHYKTLARSKQVRTVILLYSIYIISMFLSLVIHELPIINFVRRSYTVSLLLIEALALYRVMIYADVRRQIILILAIVLGVSMHYFYPVDERVVEDPIKFLLGIPLGMMIALLFGYSPVNSLSRKLLLSMCLVAYASYCFFVGSRMTGGIFFVTACLVWVKLGIAGELRFRKYFPFLLLLGLIIVYVLTEFYSHLAINGFFGERAAGIAVFQEQFFGSILLGGRPEVIVNILSFFDSPWIGQGPIAARPEDLSMLAAIGVYSDNLIYNNEESMYHSMLFASAQEAGLFATFIWLYVIYKISFAIPVLISTYRRLAFVAVPVLIGGIWNILFSPLIFTSRWSVALAIAFAFVASDRWRASTSVLRISSVLRNKLSAAG